MDIEVNGKRLQLPQNSTVDQLIQTMALTQQRLAVELNLDVVPRSQYASQQLRAGDRVEIVHAIGGG
ncbi:MAG: sulfur carrier protein ThiS [Motiliproteus sp.]